MTKYHSKKRDEAYQLYAQGMLISKVAEKVGINRKTLNVWKGKFNWDDRKKLIDQKAGQKVDKTLAENKAEQIAVFNAAMYKYAGQLKDKVIKDDEGEVTEVIQKIITSSEAVAIGKHLLHLLGEAETSTSDKSLDNAMERFSEWFGKNPL